VTQFEIVATSAAGASVVGGGGIGIVVDCIRVTATAPTVCDGLIRDVAMNAATLVSGGAPAAGVAP